MSKKQLRITTNQPGVYLNQQTGKYDIKYCYTEYNPATNEKHYKSKWICSINSYQVAVNTLAKMKAGKIELEKEDITLQGALELWLNKAAANQYSNASIRNTRQQYSMITKFWMPETKLRYITEDSYLELISKCRAYGYAEETVYNINACLRKLVKLAYRNRQLKENPFDYCDNARIQPKTVKEVITYEEYLKLDTYFAENSFYRLGKNCYPKYRLLLRVLYWTGIRIGEAIALVYNDFEKCYGKKMRIHITKSYNSAYKLLKGTKNNKTRKIPLPKPVMELYMKLLQEHLENEGSMEDRLFTWDHGVCTVMIKKACREVGIREYNCHSFRHTYII
ncbi:MAG: tyrosine-type recombinase/integrase [Clostridium sp.]|nr:tyrosine-type recombinase/integrase [Clostridium sp.]MCM1172762.1 tyrosine-type recombinase/integrase [Clostridium sp.]MCM1209172.1 tyrosine-type recombinase/integrase [Ruminococcus sp.]